jgi:hypothetical protein
MQMTLDQIDKTGLIRESYLIDGITVSECRSIFLDWAIKLPAEHDPKDAVQALIDHYGPANADHPMTGVLTEGLGTSHATGRRGGHKSRVR